MAVLNNDVPSDPLLVGENEVENLILVERQQQTLGGTTYTIDPSQTVSDSVNAPRWKSALKGGAMILATPVILPTFVAYTLSMWLGPNWWRNKVIATLVGGAMKSVGDKFDKDRKHLLQNIKPGDTVLDLGAGPGFYLKYLATGCRVVAVEPCSNFHGGYRKLAIEAGLEESNIDVYAYDVETYIRAHPDQKASFDWVICGNVLCEVDDQTSTLQSVDHLLKPGGHVYFSEHIGAPSGTWARFFQNCFNPWWRTAGAGCNCNRDSLANLRTFSGWQVISWQYSNFKVCMGPFVLGLAVKNKV